MSHKLKEAISITLVLLLTGLVLFSQQYWQIDLSLEKSITNKYSYLSLFKGITFLGKPLFLIILGFLLENETNLRYVRAIKFWSM